MREEKERLRKEKQEMEKKKEEEANKKVQRWKYEGKECLSPPIILRDIIIEFFFVIVNCLAQ